MELGGEGTRGEAPRHSSPMQLSGRGELQVGIRWASAGGGQCTACGCSSMAERQLPKPGQNGRFRSLALFVAVSLRPLLADLT